MKSRTINTALLLALVLLMIGAPLLARGGRGGGGGFGGGGGRGGGGGGRSFSGGGGRSYGGGGGRSFGGGGGRSYGGGGRNFSGGGRNFGGGGGNFGGGGRGTAGGGFGGHGGRDFNNNSSFGPGAGRPSDRGVRNYGGGGSGFGNRNDGLAGMAGARPGQLPARDFGNRNDGFGGARPGQLPARDLCDRGGRIDRGNLPNRPVQLPASGGRFQGGANGGLSGMAGYRPRPTHPINRQSLGIQASSIRNSCYHNNNFNGRYHGYHGYPGWNGYGHNGYYPYRWGGAAWGCLGGAALGTLLGVTINAFSDDDDHVQNVVYQGDTVYVNGQASGSAEDYYAQAQNLALQPMPAPDPAAQQNEWQPLGVFALSQPGATNSTTMIQLEVNASGAVAGNYLNQLTGESAPVHGSIDKQSQRVSWALGNSTSTIFDTSLSGLLADQSPVLVHYGNDNTQQMIMVRLPVPPESSDVESPAS